MSNEHKQIAGSEDVKVLAVCDGCARKITEDEVAWLRYGIHCYDCCKIIWEHGIEFLEETNKTKPQ